MTETWFEPDMYGLETELSVHHIANLVLHPQKPRSVVDISWGASASPSQQDQPGATVILGLDGLPALRPGYGAQITSTSSGPSLPDLGLTIGIWIYAALTCGSRIPTRVGRRPVPARKRPGVD